MVYKIRLKMKQCIIAMTNLYPLLQLILKKKKKRIIVLCAPQYINYGDFAIEIAEKEFLSEEFSEYYTIFISAHLSKYLNDFVQGHIRSSDLLLFTGGGWLGDSWPFLSDEANQFIEKFSQNKTGFFPQTIFFKERHNFENVKKLFEKHNNLFICLREQNSYEFICNNFSLSKDKIFLLPDMVLRLNRQKKNLQQRNKQILFCFRNDTERVIDNNIKLKIKAFVQKKLYKTKEISTAYVDSPMILPSFLGEILTERKIKEIGKSRMLITDRLHGMIFAAITGTPCLAFDNISKKVSGVYQWISHLDYIKLVDMNDWNSIEKNLNVLLEIEETNYTNCKIINMFYSLKSII